MASSEVVEVHTDVMCPWAWQTAVWLRDVRGQTGLEVRWRCFSLEEVNRREGGRHPWERPWAWGWSLLRVMVWLRRRSMDDADRWLEAAGRALHEDGRKVHQREVARQVAAEAGLGAGIVDAATDDPSTHDEVRADHQRVLDLGGFGVPTLVLGDGTPLFGPVVTPAPTGDAALRLWDLVRGWAEFPHLYELRRPKAGADWQHIESLFRPYLTARDWPTIQREVS